MRTFILSACLLAATVGAQAQLTFGPEVSLIGSNYTGKADGQSSNTKSIVSFRAGAVLDAPISDHFSIQPAVLYVMNGFKSDIVIANASVHVNTLEIPVNVMYKIDVPGDGHLFVGLGPYIAYNMGGKYKESDSYSGTQTGSLNIGSGPLDDLKVFDFGLGINAGYQLTNGLFLRVFYQKGLLNLDPQGNSNNYIRSTNYGVGVGMLFGGNHTHAHTKAKK